MHKKILKSGIMHQCVKSKVPFVLAGSLRDDGPMPETIMDMVEAQAAYAKYLKDATVVPDNAVQHGVVMVRLS